MAGYGQSAKRQKVRENKDLEYFHGIEKLEYNSSASASEAACYRYYNASERLHSRSIEEWLKLSLSFTHFKSNGSIIHTRPLAPRAWDDGTNSVENNKRCLKALFELCSKLGIKYWTAFDTDLVPFRDSWDEMRSAWDEMTEYIQEMMQKYHVKLLWLAPDLHSHHRYTYGAMTSSDAATFAMAASQIKKCIELSQRLNAECFLICPYREGYDSIYQTDVAKEIKLFAKMLKITAEYRDRLNYRCQLLIMPYYGSFVNVDNWQHWKWRENNMVNVYMWDMTSCLYFLKHYNLDRCYKVCTPPGHHMYMANVYNMLGGVCITDDIDSCDHKTFTLMMKCIIDQGVPPAGGVSLQCGAGAGAGGERDVTCEAARRADAAARALRHALTLHTQHYFNKYKQQKYQSYQSGFGSRLVTTDISIDECEEHYKKNPTTHTDVPSKEHIDFAFQRYIDFSEHV